MTKLKRYPLFLVLLLISFAFPFPGIAEKMGVISNPEANLFEQRYIELKQIKTINPDLGNGEYLLGPYSLVMNEKNELLVYDRLNGQVFVFDESLKIKKSFGRFGVGPGEFSRVRNPVFLKWSPDKKLYAHDMNALKTLVFNENGKFLEQIRVKTQYPTIPVLDPRGKHYELFSDDKLTLYFLDKNQQEVFHINARKKDLSYLFFKPGYAHRDFSLHQQVLIDSAGDSSLLVYLQPSSTMLIVKDKKISASYRLWPKDAMEDLKPKLQALLKESTKKFAGYIYLFPRMFMDGDSSDVFYLNLIYNETKGISALYKLNLKGELLKVFYIKANRSAPMVRFQFKKNGLFYGIKGEDIVIYKESQP